MLPCRRAMPAPAPLRLIRRIAAAAALADPTSVVAGGGIQSGAFAQAVASSSADDIQAAMAGISLPSTAWPAWAQDVSEKELLDRMRANLK